MPTTRATPLQETPGAAPAGAKVIDAKFNVVRGAALWTRVKKALVTTLWFALAGLLAPPLWLLIQRVRDAF